MQLIVWGTDVEYVYKLRLCLPVYALNFEILNFQQLLKRILRVFSCLGGWGANSTLWVRPRCFCM